jgi:hypothetical protein
LNDLILDYKGTARSSKPPLDNFDAKILAILDKSRFKSARSIAKTLSIVHLIVLLHLQDSIGFKSFRLHWMPHLLAYDLREK